MSCNKNNKKKKLKKVHSDKRKFVKARSIDEVSKHFQLSALEEKGRLQFFYHSPLSKLPIRDVSNEQRKGSKTEPHIENGSENFINCCYQKNIQDFLKSDEKYLFLFTRCMNPNLRNYFDKRFIIGYITKKEYFRNISINCNKNHEFHFSLLGGIHLFSFNQAIPLDSIFPETFKNVRIAKISISDTKAILRHFNKCENVLYDCIREIIRLDKKNVKLNKSCKILRGSQCEFYQNECLRWELE